MRDAAEIGSDLRKSSGAVVVVAGLALGTLAGIGIALAANVGMRSQEARHQSGSVPPNLPAVIDFGRQLPQTTEALEGDQVPTVTVVPGIGRLAQLEARNALTGWVPVAPAGYQVRGSMPLTFYADFKTNSMIDGSAPSLSVTFRNYDFLAGTERSEGGWPPQGRVWLSVTLYPQASPGFMAQPEGTVLDSLEVPIDAGSASARVNHWERTDGAADAVLIGEQISLSGGRLLVLSGGTTSPESDALVSQLLGLIASIEVVE